MPIYEYQCGACGHYFEKIQSVTEKNLVDCPACNAQALKKLISAAGFRLKGSGWYVTDFRDKSNKDSAKKSETKSNSETTAAKAESTETKTSTTTTETT